MFVGEAPERGRIVQRRVYPLIGALILTALFFPSKVSGQTEALQKATADAKYDSLQTCIRSKGNDASLCIDEFVGYFREEITLVKTYPDKASEYRPRLDETVAFLEKSANHFYARAKETRDINQFQRASRCAALLIELSAKNASYQGMVTAYENAKGGKVASEALGSLSDKLSKVSEESDKFYRSFAPYAENASKTFPTLSPEAQGEATKLGTEQVTRLVNHLSGIAGALKSERMPDFGNLGNERRIYAKAILIPTVNARSADLEGFRRAVGSRIGELLQQTTTLESALSTDYESSGSESLRSERQRLMTLDEIAQKSLTVAWANEGFFTGLPKIAKADLGSLSSRVRGLDLAFRASQQATARDFADAIKLLGEGLSEQAITSGVRSRMQHQRSSVLADATRYTTATASTLARSRKYAECRKAIDDALALPLSPAQQAEVRELWTRTAQEGRAFALAEAKRLNQSGKQFAALMAIEGAKPLGLNQELESYRHQIKRNFNFRQLQSLDQALYFVDCPSDLMQALTFPEKADSSRYCFGHFEVKEALGNGIFRAKFLGEREVILAVTSRNAVLEGRMIQAVYRVLGPSKVERALTGRIVTLPLLEPIYLEVIH
ncbi:MAG: hypothetical protein ACYC7A_21765 [Thermoanaerobaculia bacterium]